MASEVEGYPGLDGRLARGRPLAACSGGTRGAPSRRGAQGSTSRRLGQRPIRGPAAAGGPLAIAAPAANLFSDDTPPGTSGSTTPARTRRPGRGFRRRTGRAWSSTVGTWWWSSMTPRTHRPTPGSRGPPTAGPVSSTAGRPPTPSSATRCSRTTGRATSTSPRTSFFPDLHGQRPGQRPRGVRRSTDGGDHLRRDGESPTASPRGLEPIIDRTRLVADRANGNLYLVWSEYVLVPITPQVGTLSRSHILFARSHRQGCHLVAARGTLPARGHDLPPRAGAGGRPGRHGLHADLVRRDGVPILVARSAGRWTDLREPRRRRRGGRSPTGLLGNVWAWRSGGPQPPRPHPRPARQPLPAYPAWVVGGGPTSSSLDRHGPDLGSPVPGQRRGDGPDQWLPAGCLRANGVVGGCSTIAAMARASGAPTSTWPSRSTAEVKLPANRRVTSVSFPPTPHFDPNRSASPRTTATRWRPSATVAMVWRQLDLRSTRERPERLLRPPGRLGQLEPRRGRRDRPGDRHPGGCDRFRRDPRLPGRRVRRVIKRLAVQRRAARGGDLAVPRANRDPDAFMAPAAGPEDCLHPPVRPLIPARGCRSPELASV